jgi:hypothetical protein
MGKTSRKSYAREFKLSLIRELERLVGKLYAENDFLKKALGILEKRVQEEKERLKAA